jgi:hypothetical protein
MVAAKVSLKAGSLGTVVLLGTFALLALGEAPWQVAKP